MLAALTDTGLWKDIVAVGTVGAATGFVGLLVAGWYEAVMSVRENREARWSEPTLLGTLLAGMIGASLKHSIGSAYPSSDATTSPLWPC